METIWFILVALMLVAYVVLDGFDLGAGIISMVVARNHDERRLVQRAIGPVWDGNEVWLLAAGGALFFAFPRLSSRSALTSRACGSDCSAALALSYVLMSRIHCGGHSLIFYSLFRVCCSQSSSAPQ